jgi:hypothetical protein
MDIHLDIDRLVVDDQLLAPGDRTALAASVTRELGRLLTGRGLPSAVLAGGGAMPRLEAGNLGGASSDADAFGRQIAGAVHKGMTR